MSELLPPRLRKPSAANHEDPRLAVVRARLHDVPGGPAALREALAAASDSAAASRTLERYLSVRGEDKLPARLLPAAVVTGRRGQVARYLVAGELRASREQDQVRDPLDGRPFVGFYLTPRREVVEAITKADAALPRTAALAPEVRAQILRRIASALRVHRADFAELITLETGKPLTDALTEVDRAITTFRLAASVARKLRPLTKTVPKSGVMRVDRVPIGVVGAITPFNFPLNLVAHKLAPAIAAGNPILIKPSPRTPITALALAELVASTDWPSEALSVLTPSLANLEPLLADPRVRMISFTGSESVGWDIKRRAFDKRVTLELGGNAAAIVHRDADLADAVKKVVRGAFAFSGQVCIHTQRLLVHEALYDEFVSALVRQTAELRLGDPLLVSTQVGPMIEPAAARRTRRWLDEAVAAGARLLIGGELSGNWLEPTVVVDANPREKIVSEEVFGPVVVVSRYSNLEQALREANNTRFGLQAGVFTGDATVLEAAYRALQVGGVVANHVPTIRFDAAPYGGVKRSGCGREGPHYAIEEMTELKALLLPGASSLKAHLR